MVVQFQSSWTANLVRNFIHALSRARVLLLPAIRFVGSVCNVVFHDCPCSKKEKYGLLCKHKNNDDEILRKLPWGSEKIHLDNADRRGKKETKYNVYLAKLITVRPRRQAELQFIHKRLLACERNADYQSHRIHSYPTGFYSSYFPPSSTSLLFSSLSFRYSYTVNVTACPGATLMTLGVIPL